MHEIKPVLRGLIISLRNCIPDRETTTALHCLRYALYCLERHDARLAGSKLPFHRKMVDTIEDIEFTETV